MKFALTGVGSGSTARPEILVQVAQKAETLGFESVWIPEHLAVPVEITSRYPYSADGKFPGGPGAALHDPFVALGLSPRVRKQLSLAPGSLSCRYATLVVAKAAAASMCYPMGDCLWHRYWLAGR